MNLTTYKCGPDYKSVPSLFNSFLADFDYDLSDRDAHSVPATNILTEEKSYKLEVSLPGLDKKDVKIDLKDQALTISTEKKVEKKKEEQNFTKREFGFRSFKRAFTLPDDVNAEKITAEYKNGILNVLIPRVKEDKVETTKEISIS